MRREKKILYIFLLLIISSIYVVLTGTGQGLLLTIAGREYSGGVSGIDAAVRLDIVPAAGPVRVFDIPRSSIRQITIDFPRLIVETDARVYIGPFSSFTGIGETISVHVGGRTITVPLAGLRAIALNGNVIHPVPREWLGDRFLTEPRIIVTSTSTAAREESPPPVTRSEHLINWNEINPAPVVPPTESSGTPWWVGILVVAGLAGLIYLSLAATGT